MKDDEYANGQTFRAEHYAPEPESCEHCGYLKSHHPITPSMVNMGPVFRKACMIDYGTLIPSALPFDLQALSDNDKIDLQEYWSLPPRRTT